MEDMIRNTLNREYCELSAAEKVQYHNFRDEKSLLTFSFLCCLLLI